MNNNVYNNLTVNNDLILGGNIISNSDIKSDTIEINTGTITNLNTSLINGSITSTNLSSLDTLTSITLQLQSLKTYIDSQISTIFNNPDINVNSIVELANAIQNDKSFGTNVLNSLSDKVSLSANNQNIIGTGLNFQNQFTIPDVLLKNTDNSTTSVKNTILQKSDTSYVNNQLALKSDLTYVNTQLPLKSDLSYVNSQLPLKSDLAYVNTQLPLKSDLSYVNNQFGLYYTKLDINSSLMNYYTKTETNNLFNNPLTFNSTTFFNGASTFNNTTTFNSNSYFNNPVSFNNSILSQNINNRLGYSGQIGVTLLNGGPLTYDKNHICFSESRFAGYNAIDALIVNPGYGCILYINSGYSTSGGYDSYENFGGLKPFFFNCVSVNAYVGIRLYYKDYNTEVTVSPLSFRT